MKLRGLVLLSTAALGFGCNHAATTDGGSQGAPSETSVKASAVFDSIEVAGSFSVDIKEGSAGGWTVKGAEHDIQQVQIEVRGTNLVIGTKPGTNIEGPIAVAVTVPQLKSLELSGSGDVSVENLMGEHLVVDVSGSGSIAPSGKEGSIDLTISGSGSFQGKNLVCNDAKVDISGSGEVEVQPKQTLKADISGSGTISYLGDPVVTQSISGSGTISKM